MILKKQYYYLYPSTYTDSYPKSYISKDIIKIKGVKKEDGILTNLCPFIKEKNILQSILYCKTKNNNCKYLYNIEEKSEGIYIYCSYYQTEYTNKYVKAFINGKRICNKVEIASTDKDIGIGLLKYSSISDDYGMLLLNCNHIHSIGMKFFFDAIYLNDQNIIIHFDQNISPGKILRPCYQSINILETSNDFVKKNKIKIYDRVFFLL